MTRNDASSTATDAADRSPAAPTRTEAETEPQRRRRLTLEALESLSGRATVDELVAELLAAGHDAVDGDAERIRIRLHHVDLPRLADAGRIAYDVERERVRLLD